MRLVDASIKKSGVMNGSFVLSLEIEIPSGTYKTTQYFDDLGGFMTAVKDAGVFFATRMGKIKSKEANERLITKPLAPNPDGHIR